MKFHAGCQWILTLLKATLGGWSFKTSFGICFGGVEIPFNSLLCFVELKSSFQGPGSGFQVSKEQMQLRVPRATAWPWGWCAAKSVFVKLLFPQDSTLRVRKRKCLGARRACQISRHWGWSCTRGSDMLHQLWWLWAGVCIISVCPCISSLRAQLFPSSLFISNLSVPVLSGDLSYYKHMGLLVGQIGILESLSVDHFKNEP